MKYSIGLLILAALTSWVLTGCESPYVPPSDNTVEYVVEGFVEAGEGSMPTYVILTKSIPFLSEISADTYSELFVRNALVRVSDGQQTVVLTEICLQDLPQEVRETVVRQLGLELDSVSFDYCVYYDVLDQLTREQGRTYELNVLVDDHVITATTTIPGFVPIHSFRYTELPGEPVDTMARLWVRLDDPPGDLNFYRYFTGQKGGQLLAPLGSVVDDSFFDGQSFEFPLTKAESRNTDFNLDTYGFYFVGDTMQIKWATIDKPHYDFWLTYEFAIFSQGPFSSYTRTKSNVEGALGIWGGYAVGLYETVVDK